MMTHRRNAPSLSGILMVMAVALPALAQNAPPPLPTPAQAGNTVPAPTPLGVAATGAAGDITQPTASPAPASLPVVPATVTSPGVTGPLVDLVPSGTAPITGATKTYSYGTSPLSILFLPAQVDRMKQSIFTYESVTTRMPGSTNFVAPQTVVDATVAPTKEVINEPPSYPVFYLASIAYKSPSEWSLWVSGHKITSRKNDTDLTVVNVAPDTVTFSWSPTYIAAVNQRRAQKLFASTDQVKNRLLKSQSINVNETNGTVNFTLKTNQSFAVGYFNVFEGYIATPALPPVMVPSPAAESGVFSLGEPASPIASAEKASAPAASSTPTPMAERTLIPSAQGLFSGQDN